MEYHALHLPWDGRQNPRQIRLPKVESCKHTQVHAYNLLPLLPPFLLVESEGTGVTSSILPILKPDLAKALKAD